MAVPLGWLPYRGLKLGRTLIGLPGTFSSTRMAILEFDFATCVKLSEIRTGCRATLPCGRLTDVFAILPTLLVVVATQVLPVSIPDYEAIYS